MGRLQACPFSQAGEGWNPAKDTATLRLCSALMADA